MKTAGEMAKECGCSYNDVQSIIVSNNLTPVSYLGAKRLFSQIQEDFIYKTLYFERKCFVLTLESKMNKPEEQESWEVFKAKTYGKK